MGLMRHTLLIFWGGIFGFLSSEAEGGPWVFSLGGCQEHVDFAQYSSSEAKVFFPLAFHTYGGEVEVKYQFLSNNYFALTTEGSVCIGRFINEPQNYFSDIDIPLFERMEGSGNTGRLGFGFFARKVGLGISLGIAYAQDIFKLYGLDPNTTSNESILYSERKRQLLGYYAKLLLVQSGDGIRFYLGPGVMFYKRDLSEKKSINLKHTSLHIGLTKELDW